MSKLRTCNFIIINILTQIISFLILIVICSHTRYWVCVHHKNLIFNQIIIANHGCLGNRNDEGRSKMRYVMWIAEFRESSKPWTHMALLTYVGSMPVWASVNPTQNGSFALIRIRCCFGLCALSNIVKCWSHQVKLR